MRYDSVVADAIRAKCTMVAFQGYTPTDQVKQQWCQWLQQLSLRASRDHETLTQGMQNAIDAIRADLKGVQVLLESASHDDVSDNHFQRIRSKICY